MTQLIVFLLIATIALAEQNFRQIFERARLLEEKNQNLSEAIQLYSQVVSQAKDQRALAARAQLQIGLLHERLGNKTEAQRAFRAVLADFAEQIDVVGQAQAKLPNGKRDGPVVRRVWSGADVDTTGVPARDGAYLTFVDRNGDLAIHDLLTGQNRRLTKHRGTLESVCYMSVPSLDGKQVAYSWNNADAFCDLRIVGLDGSEPRVLYRNPDVEWVYPVDWSPDGKNILAIFTRKEGEQMVLVPVAGGAVRVLKTSSWRPRFSPDGRYIAYDSRQRPGSRERDIFLLDLDTGQELPLVQHPADDAVLDWTPDGKGLLFQSDRRGTHGAWLIPVAGGRPQGTPELVKPELGRGFKPMGFNRKGSYYYGVKGARSDVYIAELDFAAGKVLAQPVLATQRFVGSNIKPDWSPDGRDLIFVSKSGSTVGWEIRALCVRSAESGEVRELPSKLKRISWVRWSPDGRSLLAGGNPSNNEYGVYRIDIQTGEFKLVFDMSWPVVWSRDGKAVFRNKWNSASRRNSILERDLGTGQEKEIHGVDAPLYYVSGVTLSPDGQQLAIVVADGESGSRVLKIMPAAGGEARDLLRGVQLSGQTIAWAPDGRSVLFAKEASPGSAKTELWRISVQGGEPRKLELAAEDMRDLCVHPDGRHVAFTAGQYRSEVWVMENFLPVAKREPGRKP